MDDGGQDERLTRAPGRTLAAPPPRKSAAEARLAQALRANLRRRKASPGAETPSGQVGD